MACMSECMREGMNEWVNPKKRDLWISDGWMGACVVADRQSNKRSSLTFLLTESGYYSPPSFIFIL